MCKVGNKLSTGKAVSSPECSLQMATIGFNIFWMNIQILMYNLFFWIIFLRFLTIATHLSTRATNIWQDHPVDRIFFKICQRRIKVKYCRLVNISRKKWFYKGQFLKTKEYFPNLLETWFWGQLFVYWARYVKFWLLAYFLILLNCAKFEKDWTTFTFHILQGSPLWCFFVFVIYQKFKGGTLVRCVI